MKKLILISLFIFFISISKNLFADEDIYICERPDSSVNEVHYFTDSSKPINEVLYENGCSSGPVHKMRQEELPDPAMRKYWYYDNSEKKLSIDEVTQGKDLADKLNAENQKKKLIAKTGLTEDEFNELMESDKKNETLGK